MLHNDSHNFTPDNSTDMLEQLFNELFREYERRLYLFACKMLKSDAAAKDIIQDVFLKLWVVRDQIPEIKNIASFRYRLTENKVIDHLRASASDQKKKEELWRRIHQSKEPDADTYIREKEYHTIFSRPWKFRNHLYSVVCSRWISVTSTTAKKNIRL